MKLKQKHSEEVNFVEKEKLYYKSKYEDEKEKQKKQTREFEEEIKEFEDKIEKVKM